MYTIMGTHVKRRAGSRPGGREGHWKVRRSEDEKVAVEQFARDNGNKTVSLIIREALIAYGALPPDTPIVDRRTTKKILKALR